MPTVLFLGASVSQVAAIKQARAAGWRVVAVDADPHAVGLHEANVAETIDFTDVDRVTQAARRHRVDAVVAISTDRAVPIAAAVANLLGLPGIGTKTAYVMTDKAAMRARLQEHAIPQPAFTVLSDEVEPTWELDAIGCPAVLKPADSGGQRGVYRIDDHASLARQLPLALTFSRSRRAILERYIEGQELNAIVVARDGNPTLLTLSDRLRPPGLGFGVGWIHLYPSEIAHAYLETAGELAISAVRALGLRNGIAFPQLLVTDTGNVFVVEVAARIPAGQMTDLVRLGTGIDLVEIALAQALWRPRHGHNGHRTLPPPTRRQLPHRQPRDPADRHCHARSTASTAYARPPASSKRIHTSKSGKPSVPCRSMLTDADTSSQPPTINAKLSNSRDSRPASSA